MDINPLSKLSEIQSTILRDIGISNWKADKILVIINQIDMSSKDKLERIFLLAEKIKEATEKYNE